MNFLSQKDINIIRQFEDETQYAIINKSNDTICWVEFNAPEPEITIQGGPFNKSILSGYVTSRGIEVDFLCKMKCVFDLDEVASKLIRFHQGLFDALHRYYMESILEMELWDDDAEAINKYWNEFYVHPNAYRNGQVPPLVRNWLMHYRSEVLS